MVNISLDITFFIQMALVLACVYILNILIYRPILKVMEERVKKVSGLERDAGSIEGDVEGKLIEYKTKVDEAKSAGSAERAALKKVGLDKEAEIVGAAHIEAQSTISAAREKIEKEKEVALKSLRGMTEDMGREIAGKALGRAL